MSVVDEFHKHFYNSGQWFQNTKWRGYPAQKCPLDLWIYQEIIHELKPDLIIETGTAFGGSALFMADMCELVGNGNVVSIDIDNTRPVPQHPRIVYLHGSSVAERIQQQVKQISRGAHTVMVILDSDHAARYVVGEMEVYAPMVTRGSYLIVEDTDVNGHPICPDHGPGPYEAVAAFLHGHKEFEIDVSREKFMMTQNPRGYLKRIS